MKNYYSILQVTPDSSDAEIKASYRRLARAFHPDVNPSGAEKFKDICEAYETLSDPKRRNQYDTINGFFKSAKREEKTSSQKAEQEYKKASTTNKETKKENFSKKINDIIDELAKNKKSKSEITNGEDIYEEVSISVKEAINGAIRIINVMRSSECPHCKGRKFINGLVCPVCNGTGEKSEHKKISVKIPKNIKNGTRLRIPKEGTAGKNGGKNGDLYLKVTIESDSRIQVNGDDLIYNVPITPCEAVLGGNITVPGFDGNFTLKIPARTHSNQKFRLAGQGLRGSKKSGDLIVIVHIEIPSSLSDDEIKLYEKLRKLSGQNIRENLLNE